MCSCHFFQNIGYEYLPIAVQCFALSSLAYCVMFRVRSTTASILVSLIYVTLSWFVKVDFSSILENPDSWFIQHNLLEYANIFSIARPAWGLPWYKLIVPLASGLLLLLLGWRANRRMFR